MKLKYMVLLICAVACQAHAATWRPSDRLLQAVSYVESRQGVYTWGDNGRSLGDYQLSEAAWQDVSAWRKDRGLRTYPYETHVWNKKMNQAYAADYLVILHGALSKRLERMPSAAEIYAAYNMGLGCFAQCQYRLARVNPTTAMKCRQINALMAAR